MGRGSLSDLVTPYSTNMRNFSAATGGAHSDPPVVCPSGWGKAYRSVPPSPPREDTDEGHYNNGVTLSVEYSSSSISVVNLCVSL
jgi:hypothetical protein